MSIKISLEAKELCDKYGIYYEKSWVDPDFNVTENLSKTEILNKLRNIDPNKLFFTWDEYMSKEQLILILDNELQYDKDFRYVVKRHKRYLFHLILGTVLCMTSCFWIPFTFGFLRNLCSYISYAPKDFISNCVAGGAAVLTWIFFTGVITIPLSIFGSVTIWPLFLRKLMFYDYQDNKFHKDAYYPEILEMLKCGNIETSNAITVLGSQLL